MGTNNKKLTFDDILSAYSSNKDTFAELLSYGRTRLIPMIGAGVSRAVGYPLWSELLLRIVEDEDSCRDEVKEYVENNMFEEAAKCITESIGRNSYRKKIRKILDITNSPSKPWPSFLQDIPHLFNGPIATLNYDKVIENTFARENIPLPSIYIPMDQYETAAIYDALQGSMSAIIKVHGTIDNLESIVLSKDEYDDAYGKGSVDLNKPMPQILQNAAYGRAFLFLGCSLNQDRFMDVFCKLFGGNHYAYLELPKSKDEIRAKKVLLDKCHIYPLWYPHGCDKTEALNLLLTQLKKELLKPDGIGAATAHEKNRLPNRDEPFLFRSDTTEFIGRENQLNELKGFLSDSPKYNGIWWAVVGPGGAGKSRLAYELEKSAADIWNTRWISNNTPFDYQYFDNLLANDYRHMLLIVDVDYSGITDLGKWLADYNSRKYEKKVRVLILSRDGYSNDAFGMNSQWRSMLDDFNAIPEIDKFMYEDEYLKLVALNERDMAEIVASYLQCMYPQVSYTEDGLKRICRRLVDIGVMDRPIYALFIAESFAHNNDIFAWSADDILDFIFNREVRALRKKIEDAFQTKYANDSELFTTIETAYAESIMSGHRDIKQLHSALYHLEKVLGLSRDNILSRLENYGLITNGKIPEVKPDIVGEYFVLRYYDRISIIYDNWDFFKRFFRDLTFILMDNRKEVLDAMLSEEFWFLDHLAAGLYEIVRCTDVHEDTAFRAANCMISYALDMRSLTGAALMHPYFVVCVRDGLIEFVSHLSLEKAYRMVMTYREIYMENPNDGTWAEIYVTSTCVLECNFSVYPTCLLDDLHYIYLNFTDEYRVCRYIKNWVDDMVKREQIPFDKEDIKRVIEGREKKETIDKPGFLNKLLNKMGKVNDLLYKQS